MSEEIKFKTISENHMDKEVEGVSLDPEELFTYPINHFGLSDTTKRRRVEICPTVDGAPLDGHTCHGTTGFKICDKEANCPISGKYIYSELKIIHSSKWAYPITMLLVKDNKDTYERYVRPIFEFTENMRTQELGEWLPFSIDGPQDMKSLQLCLTRGGTAKGKSHFCHLCQIHSDDITVQQQVCCCDCQFMDKCSPRSLAFPC
jgi:hypothetical protein